jgi:hypothetical protein
MTTYPKMDHREAARVSRRFLMSELHAARAGERCCQKTTTMQNVSNLSSTSRKELADLLGHKEGSLRNRATSRFREQRQDFYDALLNEYAEKKGALKLANQIASAQDQINEWKAELSTVGFSLGYDGELELRDSCGPLEHLIQDRIKKEPGTQNDIEARFDSVQLALMTVATLEDAEKLLKSVSTEQ